MMKKDIFPILLYAGFACFSFTSCNNINSEKKAPQKDSTIAVVENNKTSTNVDYTGTYNIVDKTACDISIVIQKTGSDLNYKSGKAEGKVEIIQQDKETYLNFIAINGKSPEGDLEAKYENETLFIQNEGNAMNQYNHFKQCDAKFLELKKIK